MGWEERESRQDPCFLPWLLCLSFQVNGRHSSNVTLWTENLNLMWHFWNCFSSGGQWNSGGACDNETEPIKNETYLTPYPAKMKVLERVLRGMKTPVTYLNITRLTDYRKDGHPSVYRKHSISEKEKKTPLLYQDCSHWCLPGVPDSWNEILYAELLVKLNQLGQTRRKP